MTVNESLDKTQKRLLDFFFPRKCPFCGRMTGRELLCSRCKTELPRCDKLRTGSFGECAAPLYYEDNVRKAILDFKFKNRVENLNCFGSLMAEKAAEVYSDRFDMGAGEQKAPEEAGLRSGADAVRQPVRGLARGAAGDTAQNH